MPAISMFFELLKDWELCRQHQQPTEIEPLE
jgi:hypothetical protein